MAISPARRVAFDILRLVEGGGYASDLLRTKTAKLPARDAALAGELVFGVLRFRGQLDFLITHFSGRPATALDREVRLAFEMGIYQLRYLDRVPRHAAVSESVELVKRAHKRSATGLVNAVLRQVDRAPVIWGDRATALSLPAWLLHRWENQYGEAAATAIARASLHPPGKYIRIPANRLREAASLAIEETSVPGCYRLLGGEAPGFRQQDIGSQTIPPLLDLQPGHRLLDVCAAPGNKTAQALESGADTTAADISLPRLRGMKTLPVKLVNLDATRELPFRRRFDRILVDAPCSGTGTIGRNPEIKWRVQTFGIVAYRHCQRKLLHQALEALAPGGRLVYSTCSLEREENEDVVEQELAVQGGVVRLERLHRRLPGREPGDGFFAAVLAKAPATRG